MPHKKVKWIELFYDLIFVAAIATATHTLLHVEDKTIPMEYIAKFVLIFIPIWWAWVGQTLYINRYGEDTTKDRIWMGIQMIFVILMTASLSVNFDAYYLPFLVGYLGIRLVVAIQYMQAAKKESGERKMVATFLGYGFFIGAVISLGSTFFDSWVRYFILYLGIAIDMLIPLIGRKHIKKVAINTPHLVERFGLLTIILFGEFIVSIIAVVDVGDQLYKSLFILVLSFIVVLSMWWQYFDNLDKKIDQGSRTSGQIIVYGHLFIYMSMSVIASVIQLGFLYEIDKNILVTITFVAAFIYFIGTTVVFHKYRRVSDRLGVKQFITLSTVHVSLWGAAYLLPVNEMIIQVELAFFFILYAFITLK